MADPSSRRGSLRLPRVRGGNSRNSSLRASGLYDEFRQPSASHPLRNASSRYSLHEQFASTREEYELWDDDASSIFERVTNASEAGDTEGEKVLIGSVDDFGVLYNADALGDETSICDWDYYDILCLPSDADLSQDQIRRAYYRLFLLFYPDSYPEHLRPIARQQFLRAQEAFETLIDPARRAQYDVSQSIQESRSPGELCYDMEFKEAVRERISSGVRTSTDLGVRLDATKEARGKKNDPFERPSPILDFALSHSVAVELPVLRRGKVIHPKILQLWRSTTAEDVDGPEQPAVELLPPTVTVTGSVYGTKSDVRTFPTSLIFDRYQPHLPPHITRRRLFQLFENKLAPLVTLKYRQEVLNRAHPSPEKLRWIKAAVEVEVDALPERRITQRLYTELALPHAQEPTIIEASVRAPSVATNSNARYSLGIHQNLFRGTAFIRADSGVSTMELERFLPTSHVTNYSTFLQLMAFSSEPTLELGFDTTPIARISQSSNSLLRGFGMRGLEDEVKSSPHGSWAISASSPSLTRLFMTGFVRYSKDLALPFHPSHPFHPFRQTPNPSTSRLEMELCSNMWQDQYLALRNLWSFGRFAKLGLEVGVSKHNFHLSVYWSRLSQRISVPVLITPTDRISSSIVFWTGVLPFAGLAAWQLACQYYRSHIRRRKSKQIEAKAHLSLARRRYEADNITILLAQPVEAHQKKQMALGGLVILSAKFGTPDEQGAWTGADVADVTIALASLVQDSGDNSHLSIPKGVRKSRIPGFWDPAPGTTKTLHVAYSWKGTEGVVEVAGRDELVLPPPPAPPLNE